MTDRQIDRELLTASARVLLWIHDNEPVEWSKARREFGSNIYPQAYKLALLGFLDISENKILKLTNKGREIASCLKKCVR
ncbi:MAG: hypothetical protein F7B59_08300 [Desulfurococcales archaeon]|nr:hypothetical protein [Desulfurococcales archaeon]